MKFTYTTGETPLDGYTIKRGLGRGGFGEVYFAVSDVGKEVALKKVDFMDADRGDNLVLNIRHPHLVQLFDIKHDDQQSESWIIMEYMSGKSLRDVLTQQPEGLTRDEASAWFFAIASGVHRLHLNGFVHRDLKPGNIFQSEGDVKVGDYGLSKLISHSQRNNHTRAIGTCRYMAPEIGKGNYGNQIDIYALGIMLFELLTGDIPFDGESDAEILTKHLTEAPDLTKVPLEYQSAIRKALEKDAGKRYQNVVDMMLDVPEPNYELVPGFNRAQLPKEYYEGNRSTPTTSLPPVLVSPSQPESKPRVPTLEDVPVIESSPASLPETSLRNRKYEPPTVGHGKPPTWIDVAKGELAKKDKSQRLSELTSSMIRAVVGTGAATTLLFAVFIQTLSNKTLSSVESTQWFIWLMSVMLLSSWAVLILGKFWESSDTEDGPKRLVMFAVGAGLGTLHLTIGNFLQLDFHDLHSGISYWPWVMEHWKFAAGESPALAHYAVFTGLLFALCRWWSHATPVRTSQYDLMGAFVLALVAWFLPVAPQPLMPGVTALTLIVIQFSAPNFTAQQRKEFEAIATRWWQNG
ncbi:MAG: serine/threonine protein kinase [Pirellulales bacterium]|nr:serine/threonine protein kinase [Pirellulales bacterium]